MQSAVLHSIARAHLNSLLGEPEHVRILNALNKKVEQVVDDLVHVAPRKGGSADLVRYMMHVSWLDLGQLLYALHRGRSVTDALSALKHVTFSTRDFWTEAALADRIGLTKKKWTPLSNP